MKNLSVPCAMKQSLKDVFTMVEYPVTPAEHSSEETHRGTSSHCARWRASAGSPTWTGSSAPPVDTPSV